MVKLLILLFFSVFSRSFSPKYGVLKQGYRLASERLPVTGYCQYWQRSFFRAYRLLHRFSFIRERWSKDKFQIFCY